MGDHRRSLFWPVDPTNRDFCYETLEALAQRGVCVGPFYAWRAPRMADQMGQV